MTDFPTDVMSPKSISSSVWWITRLANKVGEGCSILLSWYYCPVLTNTVECAMTKATSLSDSWSTSCPMCRSPLINRWNVLFDGECPLWNLHYFFRFIYHTEIFMQRMVILAYNYKRTVRDCTPNLCDLTQAPCVCWLALNVRDDGLCVRSVW